MPRTENEMEVSSQQAYLANLRHELRTPLNAIIGYSELLLEEITGGTGAVDQFRTDLGNIHVAGYELLALVNEALEPSMAELVATSLETIIENLDFQLRTPINSVIGYVEMLLEDAPALGADELVSDMERIHQAANRFVELMDGMVHEAFNNGSEDLSQVYMAAEEAISAVRPFVSEQSSELLEEVHGNLLVVDDNDINREVLARRMERQGHQVKVAVNGRQALELVAVNRFDLILLDVLTIADKHDDPEVGIRPGQNEEEDQGSCPKHQQPPVIEAPPADSSGRCLHEGRIPDNP
jgi:signal transduction histidine kinase